MGTDTVQPKMQGHRIEGRRKVTGNLKYVDDLRSHDVGGEFGIASVVTSKIALGTISEFDDTETLNVPGVRMVVTYKNAPRLKRVFSGALAEIGEQMPLQNNKINYYGQAVAIVIADDLLAAQEGARLLKVAYAPSNEEPKLTLSDAQDRLENVKRAGIAPGQITSGDAASDFADAAVKFDQRYETAPHHHHAIETSAVICNWDDDGGVTVHMATQWNHLEAQVIGQAFRMGLKEGIPRLIGRAMFGKNSEGKVRVINSMSGGAFGRNINPVHLILACIAAKVSGERIKLVLTREQTFSILSHRAEVSQRLRLGADEKGKLKAMVQEPDVAMGAFGAFVEPVGETSCQIYAHDSRFLQHKTAKLDISNTGWMRGPGVSSSMFSWESAMDEIAHDLNVDPLEYRLQNYADVNPQNGKEWSTKGLRECYEAGAKAIGWHERPKGGSLREDGRVTGYGMATSFDLGRMFPASADVELTADGNATISVAVAEIGQGLLTGLTKISAEMLGLPPERIRLLTAESKLPYAAGSIGSTGTFSNGAAVFEAVQDLKKQLAKLATKSNNSPLAGLSGDEFTLQDEHLVHASGAKQPIKEIVRQSSSGSVSAFGKAGRDFGRSKHAKASFGAVFAEIAIDPITTVLTVERMVGAFACGRIISPTLATSQVSGGMVWGIGQALFEESIIDKRSGKWFNSNLADAVVSSNADIKNMEVIFIEEDDSAAHPLGFKGLAEIGVIGPAPAIANAIFDATGTRHRALPMTIDRRMADNKAAQSTVGVAA